MKVSGFSDIAVLHSAPPIFPVPARVTHFSKDDDALTLRRREDGVTDEVGADGRMMLAVNADRSGELIMKLQAVSPLNQRFNVVHSQQQAGPRIFKPSFITFQDLYRQDRVISLGAYIKKLPEVKRGKGLPAPQEWVFVLHEMQMLLENPAFVGFATALLEAA